MNDNADRRIQKRLGRKRFKELGRRRRFQNQLSAAIACGFVFCWGFILVYLVGRVMEHHDATIVKEEQPPLQSSSMLLIPPPNHNSHDDDDGGATPVYGIYTTNLVSNITTEAVYAIPSTSQIRGMALLFHACTHNALKFFSPHPTMCPQCIGLSEELRISRLLLKRGYAILALTSSDRQSKCWSNDPDLAMLQTAFGEFMRQQPQLLSKTKHNIIAIGASSGGSFAASVAAHGIARAALVMVMGLGPRRFGGKSPPLLYLAPMPRDQQTTKRARADYDNIVAKHGAARIVFDDTTCVALPVTPSFLHGRVPNLSKTSAESIVLALQNAHHLDANSSMLVKDPTRSNWRDVVRDSCSSCLEHQSLEPGVSPLAKALHRAWAFHEYCSEVIPTALDFFEQGLTV